MIVSLLLQHDSIQPCSTRVFFWVEATAVKTGREFEAICGMEPISENPKDRAWYEALGLPDQ
jgi:hypothetical protein